MVFSALQLKLLAGILAAIGTLAGTLAYEQHQQTLTLQAILNQQRIAVAQQSVAQTARHLDTVRESEQIRAAIEQSKRVDQLFATPRSAATLP